MLAPMSISFCILLFLCDLLSESGGTFRGKTIWVGQNPGKGDTTIRALLFTLRDGGVSKSFVDYRVEENYFRALVAITSTFLEHATLVSYISFSN